MNRFFRNFILLNLAALLFGCVSAKGARILSLDGALIRTEWSPEDLEKGIAKRLLKSTPDASYYLVRLKTVEEPHVHDKHDIVVFVLRGDAVFHLGDQTFRIRAGDVIEVPRGIVHAAENKDPEATEVYAVFTPPFDGKDHRPVPQRWK